MLIAVIVPVAAVYEYCQLCLVDCNVWLAGQITGLGSKCHSICSEYVLGEEFTFRVFKWHVVYSLPMWILPCAVAVTYGDSSTFSRQIPRSEGG